MTTMNIDTMASCDGGRVPGCCQTLKAAEAANTRKTKPRISCQSECTGLAAAGRTCLTNMPDCFAVGSHCFSIWSLASWPDFFATGSHFFANRPAARAICERWMDWQLGTLSPLTAKFWQVAVRTPPAQRDESAIAAARDLAAEKLHMIEHVLGTEPYIAGAHLTLADVALGFWGHRWFALGADQGGFKNLRAWYERLKTRAGFDAYLVQIPIE